MRPFAGTGRRRRQAAAGSGKTLADIIQDYQDEADALRMGNKERERHNELVVNRTIQDYLDGDGDGKGGANSNDARRSSVSCRPERRSRRRAR